MRQPDNKNALGDPSASDEFHRELEGFLHRAEKPTSWQIERVLKQSAYEVTELVSPLGEGCSGDDGWGAVPEPRLFVRKCIDARSGTGSAYEELWHAQKTGLRLAGVPHIESCERDGDELRVVMEYISGSTVASFVQAMGPGADAVRLVMPALCEVVHGLHTRLSAPLIHRDLKPSNVIMREGKPVVIDFGCARTWNASAEADTTHFLTRCYAPPEQFGFGQTDARSDVYALGKMLYFSATGENPPNACGIEVCIERGISADLAAVVGACCSLDPGSRPATAHEVGVMVENVLNAPNGPEMRVPCLTTAEAQGALCDDLQSSFESHVVVELAPRWKGIFTRLPVWVGKTWNALVCIFYSVVVVGSVMAIIEPNAHDALQPFWFRLFEYVSFGIVGIGAVCYLLLDRRRLYERIPALRGVGTVRECVWCVLIILASMLIPSAVGTAVGVL